MNAAQQVQRRSKREEQRPAEIVSAALALFAERGFEATKLEDVAKAAGIAKGTVYLYFSTKEDLFWAVVQVKLLPNLEQFEAAVAMHTGPSGELLRLLAGRLGEVMESDVGAIPKLVASEAGNFPEIARFYADQVVARGLRLFDSVLRRGFERGEFRAMGRRTWCRSSSGRFCSCCCGGIRSGGMPRSSLIIGRSFSCILISCYVAWHRTRSDDGGRRIAASAERRTFDECCL